MDEACVYCIDVCWSLQVNADIKKYSVGADGVPRLVSVDTYSVGRDISTKAVGSNRRVDLTNTVSVSLHTSYPVMMWSFVYSTSTPKAVTWSAVLSTMAMRSC